MKINDTYPVMIAGQVVAQAKITGLEDGKATLIIPATQVVMATRTELTTEEPTEGATIQIIGEQQTDDAPVEPVVQAAADSAVGEAPVVESAEAAPEAQESNVSE